MGPSRKGRAQDDRAGLGEMEMGGYEPERTADPSPALRDRDDNLLGLELAGPFEAQGELKPGAYIPERKADPSLRSG